MMEALIAGGFAVVVALIERNHRRQKKDLAVSNGKPPGFMIEETYVKVLDLDHKLDTHIRDQQAHCKETKHDH